MDSQHAPDAQWAVYEANVQMYRQLAVASQGLLLAVGAILINERVPLMFVFIIAMVVSLVGLLSRHLRSGSNGQLLQIQTRGSL